MKKIFPHLHIHSVNALPGAATAGRVVFLTTDAKFYFADGTNWTTPDGGGSSTTEIEVDFGYPAARQKSAVVVNGQVNQSSKIVVTRSGGQPTGKGTDEAEFEPVLVSAKANSGNYKLTATALTGKIGGKFKFLVSI